MPGNIVVYYMFGFLVGVGAPDYSLWVRGDDVDHGLVWQIPIYFSPSGDVERHAAVLSVAHYLVSGDTIFRGSYRVRTVPFGVTRGKPPTVNLFGDLGFFGGRGSSHLGPRVALHLRVRAIYRLHWFATTAYEYDGLDRTSIWGAFEARTGFEMSF